MREACILFACILLALLALCILGKWWRCDDDNDDLIAASIGHAGRNVTHIVSVHRPTHLQSHREARNHLTEVARSLGVPIYHRYTRALHGFSTAISEEVAADVRAHPLVASLDDAMVYEAIPEIGGHPATLEDIMRDTVSVAGMGPRPTWGVHVVGAAGAPLCDDVHVFVIDSGLALHPDLNVVDRVSFVPGQRQILGDPNRHGTHVAGTIGALSNGLVQLGVAQYAKLHGVRVLDGQGRGGTEAILAGIEYVARYADRLLRHYGPSSLPVVANLSLGGRLPPNVSAGPDVAAINRIAREGKVIFCVSAGNSRMDARGFSPALAPGAVTVGAFGEAPSAGGSDAFTWASFSNWGPAVDVLAPGVKILSTGTEGDYWEASGTSMSSPHVAGLVALMISERRRNGTLTLPITVASLKRDWEALKKRYVVNDVPRGTTTLTANVL